MAGDPDDPGPASYDPAGEVVELCRDLIRIDTSNYGDDEGPGERKAAEHVAALLDEVGIEATLVVEAEPGRTNVIAQWGGTSPWRRRPAAARPPGRRARRGRGLAGAPLLGRDPRRLRLGPRGDRHEGLRRDGAVRRPRPDPRGRGARAARSRCASPPTRRPVGTAGPSVSSRTTPTSWRTAPRRSARSAGSARPSADAASTSSRRPRRGWPGSGSRPGAAPGTGR